MVKSLIPCIVSLVYVGTSCAAPHWMMRTLEVLVVITLFNVDYLPKHVCLIQSNVSHYGRIVDAECALKNSFFPNLSRINRVRHRVIHSSGTIRVLLFTCFPFLQQFANYGELVVGLRCVRSTIRFWNAKLPIQTIFFFIFCSSSTQSVMNTLFSHTAPADGYLLLEPLSFYLFSHLSRSLGTMRLKLL